MKKRKIIKKNIHDNCKIFLSKRLSKLFQIKRDEKANLDKFIDLSFKRFGYTNDKKKLNDVLNISNNLKKKNYFIPKNKIKKVHIIKLVKINKNESIEKKKITRIKSAINSNINKNMNININKYITQPKVDNIIKSLLYENKPNNIAKKVPKNRFYIKNFINPNKYVDIKMKVQNDHSMYKSYNQQMKYFLNKKMRNTLINGVTDYHINIKHYKEIFFDSFYVNIYKNKRNNNISFDNIFNMNDNSFIKPTNKFISGLNKFKNETSII